MEKNEKDEKDKKSPVCDADPVPWKLPDAYTEKGNFLDNFHSLSVFMVNGHAVVAMDYITATGEHVIDLSTITEEEDMESDDDVSEKKIIAVLPSDHHPS